MFVGLDADHSGACPQLLQVVGIRTGCIDAELCIFAPRNRDEFARIMNPDGILVVGWMPIIPVRARSCCKWSGSGVTTTRIPSGFMMRANSSRLLEGSYPAGGESSSPHGGSGCRHLGWAAHPHWLYAGCRSFRCVPAAVASGQVVG
jgi:hypothetical protein